MDRRLLALALVFLIAACAAPGPAPTSSPTLPPVPSPSPTPGAEGVYLRAWTSQALPPEHTIGWLPTLTIADGMAIDGNVAIPMIYPGPLMVMPNVRAISDAGQQQIIRLADELGLMAGQADFTEGQLMPGGMSAHVLLTVDGEEFRFFGDPNSTGRCVPGDLRCQPEPGTAEAFGFFWVRISYLDDWLADELGAAIDYTPERLLVVTIPPEPLEVPVQPVAWPLDQTFEEFGQSWTLEASRCAVVEGDELEALLPALLAANQASVFIDANDDAQAVLARVLVPGEPSPCDADG